MEAFDSMFFPSSLAGEFSLLVDSCLATPAPRLPHPDFAQTSIMSDLTPESPSLLELTPSRPWETTRFPDDQGDASEDDSDVDDSDNEGSSAYATGSRRSSPLADVQIDTQPISIPGYYDEAGHVIQDDADAASNADHMASSSSTDSTPQRHWGTLPRLSIDATDESLTAHSPSYPEPPTGTGLRRQPYASGPHIQRQEAFSGRDARSGLYHSDHLSIFAGLDGAGTSRPTSPRPPTLPPLRTAGHTDGEGGDRRMSTSTPDYIGDALEHSQTRRSSSSGALCALPSSVAPASESFNTSKRSFQEASASLLSDSRIEDERQPSSSRVTLESTSLSAQSIAGPSSRAAPSRHKRHRTASATSSSEVDGTTDSPSSTELVDRSLLSQTAVSNTPNFAPAGAYLAAQPRSAPVETEHHDSPIEEDFAAAVLNSPPFRGTDPASQRPPPSSQRTEDLLSTSAQEESLSSHPGRRSPRQQPSNQTIAVNQRSHPRSTYHNTPAAPDASRGGSSAATLRRISAQLSVCQATLTRLCDSMSQETTSSAVNESLTHDLDTSVALLQRSLHRLTVARTAAPSAENGDVVNPLVSHESPSLSNANERQVDHANVTAAQQGTVRDHSATHHPAVSVSAGSALPSRHNNPRLPSTAVSASQSRPRLSRDTLSNLLSTYRPRELIIGSGTDGAPNVSGSHSHGVSRSSSLASFSGDISTSRGASRTTRTQESRQAPRLIQTFDFDHGAEANAAAEQDFRETLGRFGIDTRTTHQPRAGRSLTRGQSDEIDGLREEINYRHGNLGSSAQSAWSSSPMDARARLRGTARGVSTASNSVYRPTERTDIAELGSLQDASGDPLTLPSVRSTTPLPLAFDGQEPAAEPSGAGSSLPQTLPNWRSRHTEDQRHSGLATFAEVVAPLRETIRIAEARRQARNSFAFRTRANARAQRLRNSSDAAREPEQARTQPNGGVSGAVRGNEGSDSSWSAHFERAGAFSSGGVGPSLSLTLSAGGISPGSVVDSWPAGVRRFTFAEWRKEQDAQRAADAAAAAAEREAKQATSSKGKGRDLSEYVYEDGEVDAGVFAGEPQYMVRGSSSSSPACVSPPGDANRSNDGPESCAICLDEFVAESELVQTGCEHVFHAACCSKWLKEKMTCPMCRTRIGIPAGMASSQPRVNMRRIRPSPGVYRGPRDWLIPRVGQSSNQDQGS